MGEGDIRGLNGNGKNIIKIKFKKIRKKERETLIGCLHKCPDSNQTCNPDMCSDQGLTLQQFGWWDDAPTSWATSAKAQDVIFKDSIQ